MSGNLDFCNVNTLWASLLVESLSLLGLKFALISPGSRSGPLALAFAKHPEIEAIPVLDERSAAFYGLGLAKRSKIPVALVCTSGTAGANFYPAIIEAYQSKTPLLVLTADRPLQLRDCHAGQTINQTNLYGYYPNWYLELSQPSLDFDSLKYLRQTIVQAWQKTLFPKAGVVHLNIPFGEPLSPVPDLDSQKILEKYDFTNFFAQLTHSHQPARTLSTDELDEILEKWLSFKKGLIIVGNVSPQFAHNYCQSIGHLSKLLKFPVLADCLSPLRNFHNLNPYLISNYDLILRNSNLSKEIVPEIIIQIAELPTSKELRGWLSVNDCPRFILEDGSDNLDPLHGQTIHIRVAVEKLVESLKNSQLINNIKEKQNFEYVSSWLKLEEIIALRIQEKMSDIDYLNEAKVAWTLSNKLLNKTSIFIANSMSVRYAEFFWTKNNHQHEIYCNRGANGIDGILSTALGVAHRSDNTILLTGDLALLHDTNGFLASQSWLGNLTIVLVNNQGGGIFSTLPVAQAKEEFEKYFATPQNIDFSQLCQTYGISHYLIENWQNFEQILLQKSNEIIRILEIPTNRENDALWLKENLFSISKCLGR
jgi:2-succinyl-5-enolpyruvyl-6-hydroxy-3-cyclohexene-1-carboxylate synthase